MAGGTEKRRRPDCAGVGDGKGLHGMALILAVLIYLGKMHLGHNANTASVPSRPPNDSADANIALRAKGWAQPDDWPVLTW